MNPSPDPHHRHRFPAEIITHAVWLYHVFNLSSRDVELLVAERGIVVSHETVRRWCNKFGQSFADRLRRRRPRPSDKCILMRCAFGSRSCNTIFGARWIRTALYSTNERQNLARGQTPFWINDVPCRSSALTPRGSRLWEQAVIGFSDRCRILTFADTLNSFDDRWQFVSGPRAAKEVALAFGASVGTQLI
jgi:hypothetical protein